MATSDAGPTAFQVGDITVTPLSDGEARMPASSYFVGSTAEGWEAHADLLDDDGNYVFPLGCFLIESGDRRILIDAGLGPVDAGFAKGGALLDELDRLGVPRESVETVFITHFHADHVGNLVSEGVPAFPSASVKISAEEVAFWRSDPPGQFFRRDVFEVIEDRIEEVDDGESLATGVEMVALPGHTPGSAGIVISSGVERAMLLGDAIACPAQIQEAEWSSMSDVDPELARRTREALWREAEGKETLVGASHFPDLRLGRVLLGKGRRYFGPTT